MDHQSYSRLTRWALAATVLLPVGCSSAPTGNLSGFAQDSGAASHSNENPDPSPGSNGAVDSGTTPALGVDSSTSAAVDSATSSTDAPATTTVDSAPPATSFAGTFSCNLTFNYDLSSPISDSGSEMATGVLTTTENGTVVAANLGGDAGISCALTFADNGDGMGSLSPASSQSCDVTAMGVAVQVAFTSGGTADLALPMLNASIPFQLSDGPGGSLGIQGSGSLTADCTTM
jgi:hypothetical protein